MELTVPQRSRHGDRRALMGHGPRQSQEGFPEEGAMKLKEQKKQGLQFRQRRWPVQGPEPEQRCMED